MNEEKLVEQLQYMLGRMDAVETALAVIARELPPTIALAATRQMPGAWNVMRESAKELNLDSRRIAMFEHAFAKYANALESAANQSEYLPKE